MLRSAGKVFAAAWSPNGDQILTSGRSGLQIWDASTGEPNPLRLVMLPNGNSAAISGTEILAMTEGAWRYLYWQVSDEVTGIVSPYPIDTFGEVPYFESLYANEPLLG